MTSRTPSRVAGFTVVEMMIAVALGLVVLAALTAYFVQTSQNRSEMDRNSRQIENGRYAVDALRDDLMLAGFYADTSQPPTSAAGGTQWETPPACTTNPAAMGFKPGTLSPHLPVPLYGYPNGIAPAAVLACLANLLANTDVLVVRRFNTDPTPAASPDPKQVYLQQSECGSDNPVQPDPALAYPGTVPGAPFEFGLPGVVPFNLRKVDCLTPSDLWRYREVVYYVSACSKCPADNIPTLYRMELDSGIMTTEPLVEGVQDFKVEYGIDDNQDGVIDRWLRCVAADNCDGGAGTPPAWSNVVAARIHVLVRNLDPSPKYADNKTYDMGLAGSDGPFGDAYKRHVYVAQIQLANRLGPREPQLKQ